MAAGRHSKRALDKMNKQTADAGSDVFTGVSARSIRNARYSRVAIARRRNAFTLTELLMAVCIILIMLGVSTVAAYGISLSLELTRLDDTAKSIYVAVQNELTLQKSSGELKVLQRELETNHVANKLATKPRGFTGKNLYQLSNRVTADAGVIYTYLLDSVSIENQVLDGSFIIEFDPFIGDCYSVFYADEEITYNGDIKTLADREKATRKAHEPMIGYYCGLVSSGEANKVATDINVSLNVVNSEELYVELGFTGLMELSTELGTDFDINAVKIGLTVSDECGHYVYREYVGGQNFNVQDTSVSPVLLDSIEYSFNHMLNYNRSTFGWNNGSVDPLIPGDNLRIEAKVTYSKGGIYAEWKDVKENVNSLFAEKDMTNNSLAIKVNCLRHLNNLRYGKPDKGETDTETERKMFNRFNLDSYLTAHNVTGLQSVTITQTANIDFAKGKYNNGNLNQGNFSWEGKLFKGENSAKSPFENSNFSYSVFPPINNGTLDNKNYVTYDGGANVLKNFEISNPSTQTANGFFGELNGWTLKNVIIIDPNVSCGTKNSGALAGQLTNCFVSNCGVYLSIIDETPTDADKEYFVEQASSTYDNSMSERAAIYQVKQTGSGGKNAGGLVGYATNSTFELSYAAINVVGGNNGTTNNYSSSAVGGLIGSAEKCSFTKCYSSGGVAGNGTNTNGCGGFAGKMTSACSATNCYTTSNVQSNSYAGGFVGTDQSSSFSNCIAYGKVTKVILPDAAEEAANNSGGFFGTKNNATSFTDCSYLRQLDYNEAYTVPSGITAKPYSDLRAATIMSPGICMPYDINLYSGDKEADELQPMGMPLINPALKTQSTADGTIEHHGNWPLEIRIPLALVYYERYADNSANNTDYGFYCVTTLSDSTAAGGKKSWQLNTLQDRECIEDGYALLSTYNNLSKFNYKLDKADNDAGNAETVNFNAADKLRSKINLTFYEYDNVNGQVNTDSSFNAAKMAVYRLPDNLQGMTDSWIAGSTFYHKLNLTDVFAVSPNQAVLRNYTFFFNPHFAKTAVNPDFDGTNEINDVSTGKKFEDSNGTFFVPYDPAYVCVRSARQLNRLGYNETYWKKATIANEQTIKYSFEQETDINFKSYEAKSGELSNLPIGRTTSTNSIVYFINNYDGNYKKIIDYHQDTSDYQFCGLFGAIKDSRLSNIVMVASDPHNTGENYKYGHIVSNYVAAASTAPGVGALVGLAYRADSNDTTEIINCAVSGMTVNYNNCQRSCAVGGLCGFNLGTISKCTAVNKLTKLNLMRNVILNHGNDGNNNLSLGGLCGVNLNKIEYCYAGGELVISGTNGLIEVNGNSDKNSKGAVAIGGICGAIFAINGQSVVTAETNYCYSYCKLNKADVSVDPANKIICYGITEAERKAADGIAFCGGNGSEPTGDADGVCVKATECYYLSANVAEGITPADTSASGPIYRVDYTKMSGLLSDDTVSDGFKTYYWTVDNSYASSSNPGFAIDDYPFPAVIEIIIPGSAGGNPTTNYVHYGDWPAAPAENQP